MDGRKKKQSEISSMSSSISMDSVLFIIKRLKGYRFRDSMRKNYHVIWKLFCKFYQKLNIKPETWEQRIILFAGYLIDQNKKSSTVKSYISAIKLTLLMEGFTINENQYLLSSLTKACHFKMIR